MNDQETAAVARLAAMECGECDDDGMRCPLYPGEEGPVICTGCCGTGRRFPGLVQCYVTEISNDPTYTKVAVPVSPAEALHWLTKQENYDLLENNGSIYLVGWWHGGLCHMGEGPSPLLAMAAAIEASIEERKGVK